MPLYLVLRAGGWTWHMYKEVMSTLFPGQTLCLPTISPKMTTCGFPQVPGCHMGLYSLQQVLQYWSSNFYPSKLNLVRLLKTSWVCPWSLRGALTLEVKVTRFCHSSRKRNGPRSPQRFRKGNFNFNVSAPWALGESAYPGKSQGWGPRPPSARRKQNCLVLLPPSFPTEGPATQVQSLFAWPALIYPTWDPSVR
jgi:hypothetical protein